MYVCDFTVDHEGRNAGTDTVSLESAVTAQDSWMRAVRSVNAPPDIAGLNFTIANIRYIP